MTTEKLPDTDTYYMGIAIIERLTELNRELLEATKAAHVAIGKIPIPVESSSRVDELVSVAYEKLGHAIERAEGQMNQPSDGNGNKGVAP
jgi:hypothetical protein